MSHEIYYTSAPEGVRPGQQGFCTVATSPGIPKPLWDRLESISGYRHQFEAGRGINPINWAHWLIQVGGREVSVLSRVCDAGLDYTQRTNTFAHHLALEPNERAAAGPAWMLRQPGVMAAMWDGRVGPITRTALLPRGDVAPSVCNAWRQVTGDAGWAGVLAEAANKSARKPVCILCNPDQDPLPLVAEAIALLPARLRWQVTFNTYFTSLPGNAVCAWRCCLAGTPAAQETLRHAAGSLVLDLTNRDRLGAAPAGTWVDLARTGRGAEIPVSPAKPARGKGPPPIPLRVKGEPDEIDLVPLDDPGVLSELDLPPVITEAKAPKTGGWGGGWKRTRPPPVAREPVAPEVSGNARVLDTSWSQRRARSRRRWLMSLSTLALVFVAAGTWLQWSAYHDASSHAMPAPGPTTAPDLAALDDLPPPLIINEPHTAPATRETLAPPTTTVAAAPTVRYVPPPPPPPPRPPPAPIVLASALPAPQFAGAGGRNVVQSFGIPVGELDDLPRIKVFEIRLPGAAPGPPPAPSQAIKVRDTGFAGTLLLTCDRPDGFRQSLSWKDALNPMAPTPVAAIRFDPNKPEIVVTWQSNAMINRPDVVALAHATLRAAEMAVIDGPRARPQQITFKPAPPVVFALGETPAPPGPGWSMPPAVVARVLDGLPPGWQMSGALDFTGVDAAHHTPDNAVYVLRFEQASTPQRAACEFQVRIQPGWKTAQCTLISQQRGAKALQSRAQKDCDDLDSEIAQVKLGYESILQDLERRYRGALALQKVGEEDLRKKYFTTKESVARQVEQAKQALDDRNAALKAEVDVILTRKAQPEKSRKAYEAAVSAYDQLRTITVAIEVKAETGTVPAATVRLERR